MYHSPLDTYLELVEGYYSGSHPSLAARWRFPVHESVGVHLVFLKQNFIVEFTQPSLSLVSYLYLLFIGEIALYLLVEKASNYFYETFLQCAVLPARSKVEDPLRLRPSTASCGTRSGTACRRRGSGPCRRRTERPDRARGAAP